VNGKAIEGKPNELARYDYCADQIYLTTKVAIAGGCKGRQGDAVSVDTGIDCFANTLRHESHHRKELTGWWGQYMSNYDGFNDADVDMVPDDLEKELGCQLALKRGTCPSLPRHLRDEVSDAELNAYHVGWTWKPGTADQEDWAYPGKQWPKEKGDTDPEKPYALPEPKKDETADR
jgi:hypothetical protein